MPKDLTKPKKSGWSVDRLRSSSRSRSRSPADPNRISVAPAPSPSGQYAESGEQPMHIFIGVHKTSQAVGTRMPIQSHGSSRHDSLQAESTAHAAPPTEVEDSMDVEYPSLNMSPGDHDLVRVKSLKISTRGTQTCEDYDQQQSKHDVQFRPRCYK